MITKDSKFYIGNLFNPQSDTRCDFIPRGVLVVSGAEGSSKIEAILTEAAARKRFGKLMHSRNTVDFGSSMILPGFFDLHFHWVQDEVRALPKDSLLQWLEKYTFPTEARFADPIFATQFAKKFFKRLTQAGTLGGAVFSSVHECALHAAMKEALGDFVIGNVVMDQNSPENLLQRSGDAVKLTQKLYRRYEKRYAFTPRFAITTTPGVMKEGARICDQHRAFKQSHLSETQSEIDFTLSLFKKFDGFEKVKNYTEIYQKSGMLGSRSLMAHGIHLSPTELKILKKTRTVLVHCPTSNAPISEQGLGSGLFDFKKIEKAGIRWTMGSDIGGGPVLSMFDVMRSFVDQNQKAKVKGATYVRALYRSTLAGAQVLGVSQRTGNFKKGKDASFLVVPARAGAKNGGKIKTAESALKSFIESMALEREAYDSCIGSVFFKGKCVSEAAPVLSSAV